MFLAARDCACSWGRLYAVNGAAEHSKASSSGEPPGGFGQTVPYFKDDCGDRSVAWIQPRFCRFTLGRWESWGGLLPAMFQRWRQKGAGWKALRDMIGPSYSSKTCQRAGGHRTHLPIQHRLFFRFVVWKLGSRVEQLSRCSWKANLEKNKSRLRLARGRHEREGQGKRLLAG